VGGTASAASVGAAGGSLVPAGGAASSVGATSAGGVLGAQEDSKPNTITSARPSANMRFISFSPFKSFIGLEIGRLDIFFGSPPLNIDLEKF
jgi:hypothetical protein